ncbi:hypothetical protein K438DRAFT_1960450 [Mycena galopus ATCC 62051]|nr:hypothetical protein K438DRAFT_1960450 [Mycena galopus ATCC 62051]
MDESRTYIHAQLLPRSWHSRAKAPHGAFFPPPPPPPPPPSFSINVKAKPSQDRPGPDRETSRRVGPTSFPYTMHFTTATVPSRERTDGTPRRRTDPQRLDVSHSASGPHSSTSGRPRVNVLPSLLGQDRISAVGLSRYVSRGAVVRGPGHSLLMTFAMDVTQQLTRLASPSSIPKTKVSRERTERSDIDIEPLAGPTVSASPAWTSGAGSMTSTRPAVYASLALAI